jgi:hypothetical protein
MKKCKKCGEKLKETHRFSHSKEPGETLLEEGTFGNIWVSWRCNKCDYERPRVYSADGEFLHFYGEGEKNG